MHSIKIKLSLLLLLLAFSCSDKEQDLNDSYQIEFGFSCGWCGGTGFITVIDGEIRYKREIPCGENEGTTNQIDKFSSEQWADLLASFDPDYFMQLEYNQCNVCVDGCDEILRVTQNDVTHEIRYNPGEPIPGLEDFQEKLRELMQLYNND